MWLKLLIRRSKNFFISIIVVAIYLPLSFFFFIKTYRSKFFVDFVSKQAGTNKHNIIFAHWHQDELLLVGYSPYRWIHVLSSLSDDGELMTNVLRLLGYVVHRGSSTRGGVRGFLELQKALKRGKTASLAVDGPRGPIFKSKQGVIELSKRSSSVIVPVGVSHSSFVYTFHKAWNKCYLPLPFSRSVVYFGKPIHFDDKNLNDKNLSLSYVDFCLNRARRNAEKLRTFKNVKEPLS